MDRRSLPFAMPQVGSQEEETIALLSYISDDLLEGYHARARRLREQAEAYSNRVLLAALILFGVFLAQDFEFAPIPQLVALALLPLLLLALAAYLRLRLADTSRLTPPVIRSARKLSWQWVAMPLDQARMILWDTLTDEGIPLELPANPPKRQGWLLHEALGPFQQLEDEKAIISLLDDQLLAWRTEPTLVRLPRVPSGTTELLDLLKHLPRGRHVEPAPLLPPLRSIEEGQEDLRRLMSLHRTHHIFLRRLSAWEEVLPRFRATLERALRAAVPQMDPPATPPIAHPSADVEGLLGTLELVRSSTFDELRATLREEYLKQEKELDQQLRVLEKEWERERNNVHYTNDTLINSLKRQIEDMRQRALPEAEQALRESQARAREAQERVQQCEADLTEKRKQLLLAGSSSTDTPRASDERKQQLKQEIDRLTSALPEMKRTSQTLDEVVTFHRNALQRVERQLQALEGEHQQYSQARQQELDRIDTAFQTRQGVLRDSFNPSLVEIENDLKFFDEFVTHFSASLDPYRANLIMEDEANRPYSLVVQGAHTLLNEKQTAVNRWVETIRQLIEGRRAAVERIVRELDDAAIENIGVLDLRVMLLPVWYVETVEGSGALWPWQRPEPEERVHLVAPFEPSEQGKRLALPDDNRVRLRPIPILQERLDAVTGERRKQLLDAARRLGRVIPFERKLLNDVAMAAQLPRAMIEMLQPLQRPVMPAPDGEVDALPGEGHDEASDEFVPAMDGDVDEDAWQGEPSTSDEEDDDAWDDTGAYVYPTAEDEQ